MHRNQLIYYFLAFSFLTIYIVSFITENTLFLLKKNSNVKEYKNVSTQDYEDAVVTVAL